MGIETERNDQNGLVVKIKGRFDYSLLDEWKAFYEDQPNPPSHYILDLSDTHFMDSTAYGMLLLLRNFAGESDADIRILHPTEEIKSYLLTAKFDEYFDIID
jgi:anti-anti-sigma factor